MSSLGESLDGGTAEADKKFPPQAKGRVVWGGQLGQWGWTVWAKERVSPFGLIRRQGPRFKRRNGKLLRLLSPSSERHSDCLSSGSKLAQELSSAIALAISLSEADTCLSQEDSFSFIHQTPSDTSDASDTVLEMYGT